MAAKNSVKVYTDNSYYHIYNRGVEKRNIFQDQQDYCIFLSHLQTYLTLKDTTSLQQTLSSENSSAKQKDQAQKLLRLKNYSQELDLVCYALLPNHFHLLVFQKQNCINRFMNSLGTRYSMYFNRKYRRVGTLFQDVYKAVSVSHEDQLLHLSRYIHLNPARLANLPPSQWHQAKYPCTLPEFLGQRHTEWIKPHHILNYFSQSHPASSYSNFIGSATDDSFIHDLFLDP